MYKVGRHINGITLNPLEWLLDDNGKLLLFKTKNSAIKFLKSKGLEDDDIYWLTIEKETK